VSSHEGGAGGAPGGPAREAKVSLRRARRAIRRLRADAVDAAGSVGAAERAAAATALASAVLALVSEEGRAGGEPRRRWRVAAYESTRVEPPTEALRAALRAAGHEVLLPVTNADLTLDWRLDGDPDERLLGAAGLATCDLVLTPGLVVDGSGMRLGQGGGCYDGALPYVRPGVEVLTILWDDELVDDPVPSEPHDRRVDGVVTPGRGVVQMPSQA